MAVLAFRYARVSGGLGDETWDSGIWVVIKGESPGIYIGRYVQSAVGL